ncbi:hypothetical protein ACI2KS_10340 [Pseudomonas sp. NPDC087358]|uniref:hypothetical protein n=1 Tax=Pseudomonas sp. NPDC087358 TaxID=3364439 RepID=UPI00384FFFA0
MKRSTGLRNSMLSTSSFKSAMTGSIIKVWSGTAPASADAAIPGDAVLLLTYSLNGAGGGVSFDTAAADGTLQKNPAEVWQGQIAASGTPSFFRMQATGDTGAATTSQIRLQGTVGLQDADMVVSALTWTAGDERKLNYFTATIAAG